jgi:carboxypeptidase A2
LQKISDLLPLKYFSFKDQIAKAAVDALAVRSGTVYKYGNVHDTIYIASGSSPDHAYGSFGTPLAYTYEFRAGKGTGSGFILPPNEIIPNSEEVFDSLMAMVKTAKELDYFKTGSRA